LKFIAKKLRNENEKEKEKRIKNKEERRNLESLA